MLPITPANPAPDHLIDRPHALPATLDLEPFPMLLPTRRTAPSHTLLGKLDVDEPFDAMDVRDFPDEGVVVVVVAVIIAIINSANVTTVGLISCRYSGVL